MPLYLRAVQPYGPGEAPAVGEMHVPFNLFTLQTSAYTATQVNFMYLYPINVWQTAVYNQVSVYCQTAQVAGTSGAMRLGLYGSTIDGSRPNLAQLLYDWGQTAALTSTGVKTPTSAPTAFSLAPGRYWYAAAYQIVGTPTTYPQMSQNNTSSIQAVTAFPTAAAVLRAWQVSGVSGALPTSGTLFGAGQNAPTLTLTRSA